MANTVMKWRYDNGVSIGGSDVINTLIYVLIVDGSKNGHKWKGVMRRQVTD